MKTALIAALAALSATAWIAPAYAQRGDGDRGRHERGERGGGDNHRRGGGGGENQGWRGNGGGGGGERARPQNNGGGGERWRQNNNNGGGQQAYQPPRNNGGGERARPQNNGGGEQPGWRRGGGDDGRRQAWQGQNNNNNNQGTPRSRPRQEDNLLGGNDRPRQAQGNPGGASRDWNRNNEQGRNWTERGRGGRDTAQANTGSNGQRDWNRGDQGRGQGGRDVNRGGDGRRDWGDNNRGPNGGRDANGRDWNRGDQNRGRDGRDWDRGDGRRDRADDRGRGDRRDWSDNRSYRRFAGNEGRQRWNNHRWYDGNRGYDRRWSDWRRIPHGHYFNDRYAFALGRHWGGRYYWWSYANWRRPYRPYVVGYALPWDLYWDPVPYDIYGYLPPPPYGCDYVLVGRDVLLIALSTRIILDALMISGEYDYGSGYGNY